MPHPAVIIRQLRAFRFGIHFAIALTVQRIRLKRPYVDLGAALGVALAFSMPAWSQNNRAPARTATIIGTATDVNGDTIPNGTVVLKEVNSDDPRTIMTNENGLFEFHEIG